MPHLTDAFPRLRVGHLPTPLEALPRLAAALGRDGGVYVKRDDCTGFATGGNKVRQLEFYFGDALARGADHVFITGAVQSNFVRTAAAFAARFGLACTVQLEDRVAGRDALYHSSGNVLLDRLFGAEVVHHASGEDEYGADAALQAMADAASARGERPYLIHLSETPRPLGALGYILAAEELLAQCEAAGLRPGTLVLGSGSAVTHAGMLTGLCALGQQQVRVLGACVRRPAAAQGPRVLRVAERAAALIERPGVVRADDVWVTDECLDGGYGQVGAGSREALQMLARLEGLVLDPVYTAKTFAAAIALLRKTAPSGDVIVLHSGGLPAVFAYGEALLAS